MPDSQNYDASFFASSVGLGWYLVMWSLSMLGCWACRKRYRWRPRSPLSLNAPNTVPGVSILRPLKGLDPNLYENLESTFTQDYPNYEIIFSVAEEHDQALEVVRDLMAKYPGVRASIITGEEIVGVNPKVNNLVRPFRQAANDLLWIIDSNVMVDPGVLARSVDAFRRPPRSGASTPRTIGLVHHVPFAITGTSTIGSRIEEAFLNTNHAKMYLTINTIALESCVVGKSNLYRRSDVERVNGSLKPHKPADPSDEAQDRGFHTFGRFLAEDNMIASALWHELGQRHELSCDVARNVVENMSFSDYIWRRVRWIRVRKYMVLSATFIEPFTESVVLSVIASTSIRRLFDIPLWITLALHYTLWLAVDLDVYASLAGNSLPSNMRMGFVAAWAARELLALPIWMLAMCGNEVVWRGERYQVMRHGQIRKQTRSGSFSLIKAISRLRGRDSRGSYEALEST